NHKITAMTAPQTESDAYSLASWFHDTHDEPIAYYTDYSDEGKDVWFFGVWIPVFRRRKMSSSEHAVIITPAVTPFRPYAL
ncbi:hypothetical protein ACFYKM_28190, partial [Klebsiella pneumoniae]